MREEVHGGVSVEEGQSVCSQGNVTVLHLYLSVFNFFSPSIPVLSFSVSFHPSPQFLFAAETQTDCKVSTRRTLPINVTFHF